MKEAAQSRSDHPDSARGRGAYVSDPGGVRRQHNISEPTFSRWRDKYGGMEVADARRLKELESGNTRLKRLVAEQMLVIDGLKEFTRKSDNPVSTACGAGIPDLSGYLTSQGLLLPGADRWVAGHAPSTLTECLAIELGASLRSQSVILTLLCLMRLYGKPA